MRDFVENHLASLGSPTAFPPAVLTVAARPEISTAGNRVKPECLPDQCLHQWFEAQVERAPAAVAVVFEAASLTYQELNEQANRLAHHLRSLGVGPDVMVALGAERSLEMLVGLLAILKAGGAYVPLDPMYPQERLAFMLDDTLAPVLLLQRQLADKWPTGSAKVVYLDDPEWSVQPTTNPPNLTAPANLAYVIYTSGSTGQPKGTLVTHHNVVRLMQATEGWFGFNERDVWTLFHSFAFDFSVWEIWGALLYGGRLVVVPYLVSRSPDAFYQLLAAEKVTVLNQTPSAFGQLIQAESAASAPLKLALRYVVFGGEALRMPTLKPWFERHGDGSPQLVNMYGITETTVHVTYRPLTKQDLHAASVIGVPIPDLQLHILDASLQPVPEGMPGELFVGGPGLARGYHNRPQLTAERFIPDRLSRNPAARLYRTGDLVRKLPDGDLEYLGRIDQQVKIRGHRIELGEIESVLDEHPAVAACAVAVQDGVGGDKVLAAFIVVRESATPSVESLRFRLAAMLPDYMLPSRFVLVPALPVTLTGKLDRQALVKLNGTELATGTEYVAPRNDREQALAEIWQTVLNRKQVGIHDNFFELGGHSLLAVIICAQINRRFGLDISLRGLFDHPTIADLVQQMELPDDGSHSAITVENPGRQQPVPMSYAQQGMWLLHQTLPDLAMYNHSVAWHLPGPLKREKVRRALQVIQVRHEVLRTALVQEPEGLAQLVVPPTEAELSWLEVDLRSVPAEQQPAVLAERLLAEARRPFDLAQAPLWRMAWMELGEDNQTLVFTFHHSIIDDWSLQLFYQELEKLYAANEQPELAGLPKLPIQYADYAARQRQRGNSLEPQRQYWREQLRDLPRVLDLPTDQARPLQPSGRGAVHAFQLTGPVVSGLRELARQQGTTQFTVMLAAFHVWLHRYTGQGDIVVGTPMTLRKRPEVKSLIGFFLNTLPIRVQLDGRAGFHAVVRLVHETLLGAYSHADLPFEQMVELAVKEREAGRQPLYQTMFVLLEQTLTPLCLGEVPGQLTSVGTQTSKNDLMLSIQTTDQVWNCQFEYATDLFVAETVARMARHFTELLRSIVAAPQTPVCQLNFLPVDERQQILGQWNRTEQAYPGDKCVHQLFEEQVERTPDAVAVMFKNDSLNYRELNIRANRVARHLRILGVGPDVLVGLCVERSVAMLVGMLGILKAGGAYVPLDPDLPPARLKFLSSNAACAVIITQNSLVPLVASDAQAGGALPLLVMDAMTFASSPDAAQNPGVTGAPDHLAYVLYTSGSTGQPKGVEMPHRALVNLLHWQCSVSAAAGAGRTLQFASLGFDVSFQEIFSTWLAGGTLVLITNEIRRDAAALLAVIMAEKVERVFLPFVMLEYLAEAAGQAAAWPVHLKEVAVAGEQLRIGPVIRDFFQRMPRCRLWNHYGPTESHVVTSLVMAGRPDIWPDLPAIGRPLPNCQIYLLDDQLNPVPPGVVGHLYIGGICLSRGYRQRPDLTAERFVAHPFSKDSGARLYQTGDLGRYRPNGEIEFAGRKDGQVKIRGHRVELGEIEAVLSQYPAITSCAVMTQDLGNGDKVLMAFVVGRDAVQIPAGLLRTWLAQKLPDYMIPSRIIVVPKLPLNANGKLDRHALAQLGGTELAGGQDYVAPRNAREQALVVIWQEVLNVERVGIHDDFFSLGGHSLSATALCSQINRRLGLAVSIRLVFEHPTIAGLAEAIANGGSGPGQAPPALKAASRDGGQPLSPGQVQLWFLDQLEPDSAHYNLSLLLRLRGVPNLSALKRSLTELGRRHETLRAVFPTQNHQPQFYILPVAEVPLTLETISAATADRETAGRRWAEAFVRQPFDLATGPVFRAGLVSLSSKEHILALAMHHIVADGWSLEVLQRDLAQCYGRMCHGLAPDWMPLPLWFSDYAAWQQKHLEQGELVRQLAYWKQQLAGIPPQLELPADHPRPRRQAHLGASQTGGLNPSQTRALKRLAQTHNATLFLVMLSAFEVLLQRLSGQDDFVIGTPASGRLLVETQDMVGFFMNSLPLRVNLAGEPTFLELLARCRETFMQATENQGVPFHQVVTELQMARDLSQTPVFQVFINHVSYERMTSVFAGMEMEVLKPAVVDAKFDLTLYFQEEDGRLTLEFVYDRSLFGAARMAEMMRQFEFLLGEVAGDPGRPVRSYSLGQTVPGPLPPASETPSPRPWTSVVERFQQQAEQTPDAEAVVLEGHSLTYGELHRRSNQLAHYLRDQGVDSEVMVGLCAERSLEMAVAALAVLKAGGALVPIEPDLPRERIEFILADTQMPWLLTQSSFLGRLPATGARILCLDQVLPVIAGRATEVVNFETKPESIAYAIYTSGSTGRPKGVLISHAAYSNYCGPAIDCWQFKATDRVLQFARFGFDVSLDQLLTPLLAGATVVLRGSEIWDPAAFTSVIKAQRLTVVHVPPAYWQKWVETLNQDLAGQALGSLRLVQVGGDVMPVAAVRRWRELKLPSVRLCNRYGPTETTMFSLAYEVPAEGGAGRIPIGRPVGGRTIHILDAQKNPVPAGATGEIYIGGETLARGYLNRPELTAERFIPNPFSNQPGARLYQTGDLGRWLPDGNVDFMGRVDHQVKLRGYRIELGEIEAVLAGHPEITACAVIAREHADADKTLVAFAVGRIAATVSAEALRQWLGEKLPDYMVPSRLVLVPALPLNPSGKVDRKALGKLAGTELAASRDYVAPRHESERQLADIWQAVLRRQPVGVRDNFFDLGGHSLLAVVMRSQINQQTGMDVPLRWIFEHPTIERLVNKMALHAAPANGFPLKKPDPRQTVPMSFAQQRMWLLQQALPDAATYNQPSAWHLSGAVDREKVRRALLVIQARHEVLRTALVQRAGDLIQLVKPAADVPLAWQEIDLQALPPDQQAAELDKQLLAEARRPFDLAQAPLWRVAWFNLGGAEQVLVLTFHHSIVDEWSKRLIFSELECLYAAGQAEPKLPELTMQYGDYAAWQRQRLTGTRLAALQDYWREQLRDLPAALELPTELSRPLRLSGQGAVHRFQLAGSVGVKIRELAREEKTTLFTVVLAAFHVWLHRYSGQNDIVVGTPMTGRDRSEVQALIGFFLNMLPIRARLESGNSFREVVRQVRETLWGAFSHAELPFEQMVGLAAKERVVGQQPLYQVMFILLEQGYSPLRLGTVPSRWLPLTTQTSKSDLTLTIQADDPAWDCGFEYAADVFTAGEMARMAGHFTELLGAIAENPGQPVGQLRLMSAAEREQILVTWNQTEQVYPQDKCLHQLIEAQVNRTPEAVAAVFQGASLTYRELNDRANHLARHLSSLGVGANVLVGLCVERSLEMLVAALGILKAGGAYVPLDPAFPSERLAFMIEDTAMPVLITQHQLAGRVGSHTAQVVWLDEFVWPSAPGNLPPSGTAAALAYVIYTSGSTGQPKGVEISHQALVNCLCHFQRSLAVRANDGWLAITTLSFDIAGLEIWLPLLAGARVIIATREMALDGRTLNQTVSDYGATILQATPANWHLWLQSGWQGNPKLQIISGGEALPQELAERLAGMGSRAWNLYGPTETTIWSTARQLVSNAPVNIGVPVANTQVYILDAQEQPVPVGVVGDLVIGGDGVARGYRNRPELTAERFVPDPFSQKSGARRYRTGDLARWREDGSIEYLGRADQQVKLRGYRIELGEIEAVLGRHPEMAACAVVAQDRGGGDKVLVAFMVGRNQVLASASSLRQWLAEKLPDYMIPSRFVVVPGLPLSPNGKLDRKAVAKLAGADLVSRTEPVAPRNEREHELVKIWQTVLQREPVGVLDNFFTLGGHSLLAVTLCAHIHRQLGVTVPLRWVFDTPTVAGMAAAMAALPNAKLSSRPPQITPAVRAQYKRK